MIPGAKAGLTLCTLWGWGGWVVCLQAGITAALLGVETWWRGAGVKSGWSPSSEVAGIHFSHLCSPSWLLFSCSVVSNSL